MTENRNFRSHIDVKTQLFCCWSIPIFVVLFSIGFALLGKFFPAPPPDRSPAEVVAFFRDHSIAIRVGLFISMYAVLFQLPFCAVMATQMERIERGGPAIWTKIMIMFGGVNIVTFTIPFMIWQTAAFRFDRDPQLVVLLNDMAWLTFVGMTVPFIAQPIAFGICVLQDKGNPLIFPRWAGWFSLGAAALTLPQGMLDVLFHGSHFGWNGLFGFWVGVLEFFIWTCVMFFVLRTAVVQQAKQEKPADNPFSFQGAKCEKS